MKKLLALVLSLVMLCTLTIPAFADGPATVAAPYGQDGNTTDVPLISYNPDNEKDYDDWDDDDWDDDAWYIERTKAEWAETCEEEPELTAQFLAELDSWFVQEYPWYDSFEEFCQYFDCPEEAYLYLFPDWSWEYIQQRERNEFLTAHGGVPGQINVMVNGKCVLFSDAMPEVTNDRTMAPFRAVLEALGAEVSYNSDDDFRCTIGGFQYSFAVGSTAVKVTPTAGNGADVPQPEDIAMDCAPYIKEDRAYIPVRFISEALGYRVDWDEDYNTAVITDIDALAEEIDKDFTCYNRLMNSQMPAGQSNYLLSGTADTDLTVFNSLDGDETYQYAFAYDFLLSDAGVSGVVDYDFSLLWELFQEYIPMPLVEGQDDYYQQQLALLTTLLSGRIDVRVDAESQMAYFSVPALMPTAWFSASLEDVDLEALIAQLSNRPSSVGELICRTVLDSYTDPVRYYDSALEGAGQFALLLGDEKFVPDGSARVLTLTADDIHGDELLDDAGISFSTFTYTLRLEENNDLKTDGLFRIAVDSDSLTLGDILECSVSGAKVGDKTQTTTQFHVRNMFKMTVKQELTVTSTQDAPTLTPPQGALILDIEKLSEVFGA